MKRTVLSAILCLCILMTSCATSSQKEEKQQDSSRAAPVNGSTIEDADTTPPVDSAARILEKYRNEGFVDPNTYSIIIVRPADSSDSREEILSQAEKRAYVSFQKHVRMQGNRVDKNTRAAILNLVNTHGKLTYVEDSETSRTVYLFVISRDRLKHYIENL